MHEEIESSEEIKVLYEKKKEEFKETAEEYHHLLASFLLLQEKMREVYEARFQILGKEYDLYPYIPEGGSFYAYDAGYTCFFLTDRDNSFSMDIEKLWKREEFLALWKTVREQNSHYKEEKETEMKERGELERLLKKYGVPQG